MLLSLHGVIQSVAHWAEACPCHEHVFDRGLAHAQYAAGAVSCPLRGKRAPELACGALTDVLRQLAQLRLGALLAGLIPRLQAFPNSALVIDKIAKDFDKAKLHLLAGLQNKSSCWHTLPWLLMGVGHHDPALSRIAARRSLNAWDALDQDVQCEQHSVSKTLLGEASDLRERLVNYSNGGDLHESLLPWVTAWR